MRMSDNSRPGGAGFSHACVLSCRPTSEGAKTMTRMLLSGLAVMLAIRAAFADPHQDCEQPNNPKPAIAGCSEVLLATPNDAGAYYNRGIAHWEDGDLDAAIAEFSKTIELEPGNAFAYHDR